MKVTVFRVRQENLRSKFFLSPPLSMFSRNSTKIIVVISPPKLWRSGDDQFILSEASCTTRAGHIKTKERRTPYPRR